MVVEVEGKKKKVVEERRKQEGCDSWRECMASPYSSFWDLKPQDGGGMENET